MDYFELQCLQETLSVLLCVKRLSAISPVLLLVQSGWGITNFNTAGKVLLICVVRDVVS